MNTVHKPKRATPEYREEMAKRKHRRDNRVSHIKAIGRSKYNPNELPLYPKSIRQEMRAIHNG